MSTAATYKPSFDTTIRTSTVVKRHATKHVDWIDWENYPFDDPEITRCMCCSDEQKRQRVQQLKAYLKTCEYWPWHKVYASNYGGWPRIWQRVLAVGMVSKWPYWTPRPAVLVTSTLGNEWYDWASLTGAEIKDAPANESPADGAAR